MTIKTENMSEFYIFIYNYLHPCQFLTFNNQMNLVKSFSLSHLIRKQSKKLILRASELVSELVFYLESDHGK